MRSNRVFMNFPQWGDDVPFTVAEVMHGKAVAYPDAAVNDWPGRRSATLRRMGTMARTRRTLSPTMSLSEDGYLYVTANQLFNQPSMHNGKDLRQRPYVLFRVKVNARPVRLQ